MDTTTTSRHRSASRHPVDEVLPAGRLGVYGLQHVLAFYAGAVIVPILLANAIGLTQEQLAYLINADLFTCGIASIIQTVGFWKVGVRLPLLQGVTFAAVSPMISIGLAEGGGVPGLRAIFGAVIVAGIFAFLVAPFFANLIRLFPPVVTGTVITIIGLVLLSVAALDAGGGGASQQADPPTFGALPNLALAFGTLAVILALHRFGRGFVSTIAVLIGLVAGTAAGAVLGFTDFGHVDDAALFGVTTPFHFGVPTFNAAAIVSMLIIILVTMVETTGDVFACGEIVGKRVGRDDVARAIRADGLSTALGGVLNSFPYTCFAENVGLVRLTGVRSRWVVATAGLLMMAIGVVPKVGAVVAAIPHPVLGGAGFALFGTVAVVGVQTLRRVDFHDERNVIVVAVSLAMAIAPTAYPTITADFPEAVRTVISSGITMGGVTAILLNLVFNLRGGRRDAASRSEGGRPPGPRLGIDEVNRMDRDRFVATFAPLVQGREPIAERAFAARPFAGVAALRAALHDALFSAPPEERLALIRSYPDIGRVFDAGSGAGSLSVVDQAMAGLDRLDSDEHHTLDGLTSAYRERFGFPLIIAVRENTKETIMQQGGRRLDSTPTAEQAAAVVEIARITNLRLQDRVAEPESEREVLAR